MNAANSSQAIRRLRNASLWTFGISLLAIVFFSPFNILSGGFNFDQPFWFVAPVVAAAVAVLAIAVYLVALSLGQDAARRELVEVLAGQAARDRPIILLLLPFDFAEPGPIERAGGLILGGLATLALLFGAAGRAVGAPPTHPYGFGSSADFEQQLGSALAGVIYDAAERLDDAIDSRAELVTIGNSRISCGSDTFGLNNAEGPDAFRRLAEAAVLILIVADMSPAVLWELSQIVQSGDVLAKTVFIMPQGGSAKRWAALAEHAAGNLGATLPPHDDNGCCFRLTADRHPGDTAALESFTAGLQGYLEGLTTGAFSVAELWRSVETSPVVSAVLPKTASDLARRVTATRYVEDGEALIRQLGGTVIYQETGEIFTSTKITVRVFGEEHAFESRYDMVQWIIKVVVPRAMSAADAGSLSR
jgi:hypothetical protein